MDDWRSESRADPGIAHHQRIPGIGIEIHLLLHPTLQGERQIILHLPGRILMLRARGKLDEDTDTIALPYLHILSLITCRLAQIRTIHIDAEARLIAILQSAPKNIANPCLPDYTPRREAVGVGTLENVVSSDTGIY